MGCRIEVLFTPAEFQTLRQRDLSDAACVVFDVLRATSSFVAALHHGAAEIFPVEEIADALELRRHHPRALLAGERNGLRIGPALTGGVEFDLGNSPREFARAVIAGKTVISTTTNGTRALRACAGAKEILAACFLNLSVTADFIARTRPAHLAIVCAGTHERTALEDALAAGALCKQIAELLPASELFDSAQIALRLFREAEKNLAVAFRGSENARRLLAISELQADVGFCLQRDVCPIVVGMGKDGALRKF